MISENYGIVLELLKASCRKEPTAGELPEITDWDGVMHELKAQTVLVVPADVMARRIPPQQKKGMVQTVAAHVVAMNKYLHAQDELVRLLEENHVPAVILKGLSAARYYPRPEYRTLGDIDIAVLHEDYDRALRVMRENGYREADSPYEKHSELVKGGILFELHRYFASTNSTEKALFIEQQIQDGIRERVWCEVGGYRFPTLPPMAEGLMLLEHMSQHLESGIGLRHLLDWMLFVREQAPDEAWASGFEDACGRAGLKTLAEVCTKACVRYLGLTGVTWCERADDAVCERLMDHIAERGNFGYKTEGVSEKTQKVMSTNRRLIDWFWYLQKTGLQTLPFIRAHRVLHPFAWLCRGCVLLGRLAGNKATVRSLREDYRKGMALDTFLNDLGVRRTSRGRTYWAGDGFIKRKR